MKNSLICKKNYKHPDFEFVANETYICTKRKNSLYYSFKIVNGTFGMQKETLDEYFYTTLEMRKMKLIKIQNGQVFLCNL